MNGPALRVAVVYPDLLGTYGDGGNGLIVARRAAWRGIPVELLQATSGSPVPEADLYCLGGGEDGPQVRAAEMLAADGTLVKAAAAGAVVLAVCAGYQIAGHSFPAADGRPVAGLGLLDVTSVKGSRRAVGELLADPIAPGAAGGLPPLSGFENHGATTTVGPGARPLARVVAGVGNGGGDRTEGAWTARIVGTYLHGPVLARNPQLADRLLEWAVDGDEALHPLDDRRAEELRAERLGAARARRRTGR